MDSLRKATEGAGNQKIAEANASVFEVCASNRFVSSYQGRPLGRDNDRDITGLSSNFVPGGGEVSSLNRQSILRELTGVPSQTPTLGGGFHSASPAMGMHRCHMLGKACTEVIPALAGQGGVGYGDSCCSCITYIHGDLSICLTSASSSAS